MVCLQNRVKGDVSAHLGCCNKKTILSLVAYKQQKSKSHSCGDWHVQDQVPADSGSAERPPAGWGALVPDPPAVGGAWELGGISVQDPKPMGEGFTLPPPSPAQAPPPVPMALGGGHVPVHKGGTNVQAEAGRGQKVKECGCQAAPEAGLQSWAVDGRTRAPLHAALGGPPLGLLSRLNEARGDSRARGPAAPGPHAAQRFHACF